MEIHSEAPSDILYPFTCDVNHQLQEIGLGLLGCHREWSAAVTRAFAQVLTAPGVWKPEVERVIVCEELMGSEERGQPPLQAFCVLHKDYTKQEEVWVETKLEILGSAREAIKEDPPPGFLLRLRAVMGPWCGSSCSSLGPGGVSWPLLISSMWSHVLLPPHSQLHLCWDSLPWGLQIHVFLQLKPFTSAISCLVTFRFILQVSVSVALGQNFL